MLTSVLSILQTLGQILLTKLLLQRSSSIQPVIFTNIIFQLFFWVITEEFQKRSENSVRCLSLHLMILLLHFLVTPEQFGLKKNPLVHGNIILSYSSPLSYPSCELAFLSHSPHLTPEVLEQSPYRCPSFIPPTVLHTQLSE